MIVVIGAGLSGLSCAWHLREAGVEVVVLEAGDRVGGKVRTVEEAGCRLELGPNTLYAHDGHRALLARLGLDGDIVPVADVARHRHVLRGGEYRTLPGGPLAFLCGGAFSARSKWRLLTEPFRRNRPRQTPETVAAFFRRRLGQEMVERLIDPFIGGVFAGDPEHLLASLTLPAIYDAERDAGSILLGMLKRMHTLRRRDSFTLRHGLESLPRALAAGLDVRLSCPALGLERGDDGWTVVTAAGPIAADAVVLALPAPAAAALVEPWLPRQAQDLAGLGYAPMAVVHTVFRRTDVGHALNGFGALHPRAERPFAAGAIWSGSLFPDCVPAEETLLTSFVGGMQFVDRYAVDDQALLAGVNDELARTCRTRVAPLRQRLTRWAEALPQYDERALPIAHAASVLAGERLHVCANWHDGVSMADCLEKGERLARRLAGDRTGA